jgi:hypothetical protein
MCQAVFETAFLIRPRQLSLGHGLSASLVEVGTDLIDHGLQFSVVKEMLND